MTGPFRKKRDGTFRVQLQPEARELLRGSAGSLRALLEEEEPATDPAMARLYPAAHPDDPMENLEYERVAHADLVSGRREDLATLERTIDADHLTADEMLAWMRVANDMRLVLGVRLDITEDHEPRMSEPTVDDPRAPIFALYDLLTWLVANIVDTVPV